MAKDTEKLIRQLSLISFLMAQGRPVSALEIKREVEGYSVMNEDAFARRFYADRAELDSLGIELQVDRPGEGFFEAEHMNYPYGVHLALVEVEPATGFLNILKYTIAYDIGRDENTPYYSQLINFNPNNYPIATLAELAPGVELLENLRFDAGEEGNDPAALERELANLTKAAQQALVEPLAWAAGSCASAWA